MANPKIFIRRSATPNKVPTSDQLALGELAINTNDGKLYLEKGITSINPRLVYSYNHKLKQGSIEKLVLYT